jgi:hypothetical protein
MNPRTRISLNLLLPGVIAGGGIGFFMALGAILDNGGRDIVKAPLLILFIIAYATAFTILPAAVSTAILEALYRRQGLSPNAPRAVVISAFLGLLSGAAMVACTMPWRFDTNLPALASYAAIGTVTGTLTGLIVRWVEIWRQRQSLSEGTTRKLATLLVAATVVIGVGGLWGYAATHPGPYDESTALTGKLVTNPTDTASWTRLQALAASSDYWTRFYGLVSIGQVGIRQPKLRPAVTPILVNALDASLDQATTRETILSISGIGTSAVEAAWTPLTGIIEANLRKGAEYHGERDVAWFAVEALGKVRSPALTDKAITLLTRALARPPTPGVQVQAPAIRYSALSALTDLAGSASPDVRNRILTTLRDRETTADPYLAKQLQRAVTRITSAPPAQKTAP